MAPLLTAIGVAGRFRVITLGEEVPRGKPAPDIFLEAARRLGVAADRCLVFEDAPAGIQAAKSAGCGLIIIEGTLTAPEPNAEGWMKDYRGFGVRLAL